MSLCRYQGILQLKVRRLPCFHRPRRVAVVGHGRHNFQFHTFNASKPIASAPAGVLQLQQLREQFLDAVKCADTESALIHYHNIKVVLGSLPKIRGSWKGYNALTVQDISSVSLSLSHSNGMSAATLTRQLLQDCWSYFGVPLTSELFSHALHALINSNQAIEAENLLLSDSRSTFGDYVPSRDNWLVIVKNHFRNRDLQEIKRCLGVMKDINVPPTLPFYKLLFRCMFAQHTPPSRDDVLHALDCMRKCNVTPDDDFLRMVKNLCRRLRLYSLLRDIEEFKKDVQPRLSGDQVQACIKQLRAAMEKGGRIMMANKLVALKNDGFIPDARTLPKLMTNVTSSEEMRHLARTLGVEANKVAWSVLIKNALDRRGLKIALSIYEEARASGIHPDSVMVHPLLRSLCNSSIREPSKTQIQQALSVYYDLKDPKNVKEATSPICPEDVPGGGNDGVKTPSTSNPDGPADTAIYNTLLRALTSSSWKTDFFPVAFDLLNDMSILNVPMDTMTAASVTVLFIRSSHSYEEASRAYHRVRSVRPGIFDGLAYTAILNAYCTASYENDLVPPADSYFEILKDMQREGHTLSREVYSMLLRRYASTATDCRRLQHGQKRDTIMMALEAQIRRTHDTLTLDPSISPDVPLWNQLMDAYNRLADFSSCLQVWNAMWVMNSFDNASVSIVLDACGFAQSYGKASSVFTSLLDSGFTLDRNNWKSWVECLCRLGRLDDATKVVCLEMPQQPDECRPDSSTLDLLMKFARRNNQEGEVLARTRRYLGHLFDGAETTRGSLTSK
ncbi:hypothetical protein BD410DRAFT_780819 [Rickenella mellea]|uniref:Pentacotripeptide-repeat region of PRORP domain-containing protein n=1 Tax=Rickenella mellea TaxID=50990 RepID=A0A4Y7QN79_9AGAM|nr:hypothetical protein BD410DRAFT_780819 [Rickenella mellea]